MSGPAYNLANNTVPSTEGPGGATASPTAAEETKNCGNVDVEKITLGKISDTVELLEVKAEVDERITIEVLKEPESRIPELITTHVPLNQLDFDVEFGFGDGKPKNSKSCKTVSLINAYADIYGVDRDSLRKTVEEWKNNDWIDKDGSPIDINKMSNSLAKNLGLPNHFEIPGTIIDGKWKTLEVPLPFRVPYKLYNFGIVKQESEKYNSVHYVYLSNKINGIIDSLDPDRDEAPTYTMSGIQPFEEYKNY